MILKLLLVAFIGVMVYRFFGGTFPSLGKYKEQKKMADDTLVECVTCGTYVTHKEAIVKQGKTYCSIECIK
jgi:uncharacterized protein